MSQSLPILYVKPNCPWCNEVLDFFSQQGVKVEIRDVMADMHHMRQLVALTGQSKCPSFSYGEFVIADFGIDEFKEKIQKNPTICKELRLIV